jgi:hypothetical protein
MFCLDVQILLFDISQLSCSKTLVFRLLLLYVPRRYVVLVSCVGMVVAIGRIF